MKKKVGAILGCLLFLPTLANAWTLAVKNINASTQQYVVITWGTNSVKIAVNGVKSIPITTGVPVTATYYGTAPTSIVLDSVAQPITSKITIMPSTVRLLTTTFVNTTVSGVNANVTATATTSTFSATLASDKPSGQHAGDIINFAVHVNGAGSYEHQFWLRAPPNGEWAAVGPFSGSNTFRWDTAGLTAGNYLVLAWTRIAGTTPANGIYDAAVGVPYILAPPRVATAGVKLKPIPLMIFTATGTGGDGVYEHQFWVQAPGGEWLAMGPFSSVDTFRWDTSSLSPGNYLVRVRTRTAGSEPANGYDTEAIISYTHENQPYYEVYGAPLGDYNLTRSRRTLIGTSHNGNTFNVQGFERFIIYVPAGSPQIHFDSLGLDGRYVTAGNDPEHTHYAANMMRDGGLWSVIEGAADGKTMVNDASADAYYSFTTDSASVLTVTLRNPAPSAQLTWSK